MIVLDTNIISELMRQAPEQTVVDWFSAQPQPSIFTTAVTEAEILLGIALLPDGQRKQRLSSAADVLLPASSEAAYCHSIPRPHTRIPGLCETGPGVDARLPNRTR